ncbi:MAG: ATP-binding protein [Eubacteriales bacterium]|nr:ATP-binding protein [Eubacteriales bacterium]
MGNPFTLTFGKKPTEYIIRRENIEEIESNFLENPARCQTYLIRGVRGSGKTVLMTAIAKEIAEQSDWVCVDLNSSQNLLDDLSYRLLDECEQSTRILDRGMDISVAGFGIGFGSKSDRDSVSRCEEILNLLKKQKKRLLITIDEVCNDQSMKQFASQFQIWLRKEYDIFLLMTGLFENINAIQNDPQLTFLLRSPKITLEPLGISQIARQYEKALNITKDIAVQLGKETKGYAFAFQALGMLYYDSEKTSSIEKILDKMDEYLDEYVYKKIWSGLSEQDRNVVMQLSDDKAVKVKDICEATGMTSATFSKYRERLVNKGLITTQQHGYVELALPRFKRICEYYL